MTPTVMIAGGGTGGHVVPSLALAEALRTAAPDLGVEFLGTARGLESRLVPAAGWTLHVVEAAPLARKLSAATLRLPFVLLRAARQARDLLRSRNAVVAVVFGGYVSMPLALAARWARVPLVVHEQNAVPGLANRLAGRWATIVALTHEGSGFGAGRRVVTGNPVRPGVAPEAIATGRAEGLRTFDLDPDRTTLLVFGGSQGAQRINTATVETAPLWSKPGALQILHAAGTRDGAEVQAAWESALAGGGEAPAVRCVPFIERMDLAYAAADVVVCRSGASTLAELTVAGIPSVLVPYPHATADHQMANARALAGAGGAVVVADEQLTAARLVAEAEPLLTDPFRRDAMATAARAAGHPDAAVRLAALVLEAAGRPAGGTAGMRIPSEPTPLHLDPTRAIHLVGIGGAGMSALASILLQRGQPVTGSDLRGGRATSALAAMGAQVHTGHDAAYLGDAGLVVVSTAVPPDNPELVAARERGVAIVHRAQLLAALMADRRSILVAGTHGKTTTTSMLTVALQRSALDPSFAIGGMIHEQGTSAHHGLGDLFVAEADESDRSLLVYAPDCAVVTNAELDHHDEYADLDDVLSTYERFLSHRTAGAPAILCADDHGARRLAATAAAPVVTYGQTPDADVQLTAVTLDNNGSRCVLRRDGADFAELFLRLPGLHNLLNATAGLVAATWAGATVAAAVEGLALFGGAQRRFQRIGTAGGVTVIDDYAHHPTELAATLNAARQAAVRGRLVAVFQPHRYSRTAALAESLGRALAGADVAVVTDVYGAGEAPVPGVTGALVAAAAAAAGVETHYVDALPAVPAAVADLVSEGDLVLTMGAGDITLVGPLLLQALGGAPAS